MRLFCFPYAGAGASVYRLWSRELPDTLDVLSVQLPGRENRAREPALRSIAEVVEALVPALLPHLDLPFAFFGHSMGAVLATEVARALESAGAPSASHLFVSSRRPVHMPNTEPPIHHLADASFIEQVQLRYGGIPEALLREAELMALLLPSLRADFAALETHRPPTRAPLTCAISAFGGADDPLAPREQLEAWRKETSAGFRVRIFEGGHFYLTARRAELLADLGATLAPWLFPAA